jgi:hypothetical protein
MNEIKEITDKFQYLKKRKRLDLLKSRTGICYYNIMKGIAPASDTAMECIREAYKIAVELEVTELRKTKREIEDRLLEIGGVA